MGQSRILLTGLGPPLDGLTWESDRLLRIGRQANLEVVLRDQSVDRIHAEVRLAAGRWIVRDLTASPLYPTFLNREPLQGGDRPLAVRDTLRLGKVTLEIAELDLNRDDPGAGASPPPSAGRTAEEQIRGSGLHLAVQASTTRTWGEALDAVVTGTPALHTTPVTAPGRFVRQHEELKQGMRTLLRTNQHLARLADLDQLLRSVLADVVATLDAQRGVIVLADQATGEMMTRALHGPGLSPLRTGRPYSRTLIDRCFRLGESLLCRDVRIDDALVQARSVRQGTMSSIICALLRSPRQRLGVLHLDRGPFQEPFGEADLHLADALAASVAVGIESAQLLEQQRRQFVDTVQTLARAVEMRDQYTGEHTRRVTDYALLLAEELRLSADDRYRLQIGTPLHDIGKIGIDDAILRKPGRLTPAEFAAMKTHTTKGAAMLTSLANMAPMIPIIKHHHERYDGTGYPEGLKGEQIPLAARIVAVADAFDAMTSDRPYRRALAPGQAFDEVNRGAGTHFDPRCANAFLRARAQVENLLEDA